VVPGSEWPTRERIPRQGMEAEQRAEKTENKEYSQRNPLSQSGKKRVLTNNANIGMSAHSFDERPLFDLDFNVL
jgi:hypothetical protein